MMAKQTKQQKIKQLMALLHEIDETETPLDFSKVLKPRWLSAPLWAEIADQLEDKALDLKHPLADQLADQLGDYISADDNIWFVCAGGDFGVLPGSAVVQLLDDLKKELGPDPQNATIVLDPDGLSVAQFRDPTHSELDRCLRVLQKRVDEESEEQKNREREEQERAVRRKQTLEHGELLALVDRVGAKRALKLLRDAAKGEKE